jgi:hypothetical protein
VVLLEGLEIRYATTRLVDKLTWLWGLLAIVAMALLCLVVVTAGAHLEEREDDL